ncbi:hypothetical protein CCUS01_05138 [Colletotrichum cuscutae]|uniref:Uncharacterized protein n=1 Tax=Colletotrichum cuscutae TaxID=1209917 RepID=A0AAI9VA86_9PEZI|nr:hypothetical protein CCUS01_05138 [Colletotrichum cuscutae]
MGLQLQKGYPGNPITPFGARKSLDRWAAPAPAPEDGRFGPGLRTGFQARRRQPVFLVTIALWAYTVLKFALCGTIEICEAQEPDPPLSNTTAVGILADGGTQAVICYNNGVLSEGDKRDSKSDMPRSGYFAPEPASRTRPRRIYPTIHATTHLGADTAHEFGLVAKARVSINREATAWHLFPTFERVEDYCLESDICPQPRSHLTFLFVFSNIFDLGLKTFKLLEYVAHTATRNVKPIILTLGDLLTKGFLAAKFKASQNSRMEESCVSHEIDIPYSVRQIVIG